MGEFHVQESRPNVETSNIFRVSSETELVRGSLSWQFKKKDIILLSPWYSIIIIIKPFLILSVINVFV
jgi:hypothetical protein